MTAKPFTLLIIATGLSFGTASCRGCAESQGCAELAILAAPIWVPIALISKKPSEPPEAVDQPLSAETIAAAEKGDAQAQFELGLQYELRGDFSDAALWYGKSAEQGHAKAQVRLGVLYEIGNGVERDYVKGDAWYTIAATSGKATNETAELANKSRDDLEKRMTPERIAEAQKRAREWKPIEAGSKS